MVRVEFLKDEVATVSFNSGKRSNLLSLEVIRQLTDTAKKLAHNKKLMAVSLSGGLQNFSFGFDLKPIVVVNKIDRKESEPDRVINEVFDLFDNLGATEEQLDFPMVYTSAVSGQAGIDPEILEDSM